MLGNRGRTMWQSAAQMRGDPLAAEEYLDGLLGDASLDLLMHEVVRNAVVMLGDLDVIIEVDPAALPLGILVRLIRQGGERRTIELLEQLAPTSSPTSERSIVQIDKERVNCLVEGGEREEVAVAQACQNPAPDDLDPDFDLGFVARTIRPRWDDGGAVMAGEIGIGPVDHRLVKASPGDASLQIVAHRLPGGAAEIGKCPNMRGDPIRQALAEAGLGVGVVRGAEHGDKYLRNEHFAGEPIGHLHGVARIVDEQLLAGDMDLAQGRLEAASPFLVAFAEPRIAEAVGVCAAILLPQQHQRDVRASQLAMYERPIRLRTLVAGQIGGRRIQAVLELDIVIQLRWQRPGQAGAAGSVEVLADRALGQPQAAGNGALRHADAVVKA